MLIWLNKSVATINAMLKILDIMSLRYTHTHTHTHTHIYNKFGFRIGTINLNMFFHVWKCTKMDEVNTNGPNGMKWTEWKKNMTEWEQGGPNRTKVN